MKCRQEVPNPRAPLKKDKSLASETFSRNGRLSKEWFEQVLFSSVHFA